MNLWRPLLFAATTLIFVVTGCSQPIDLGAPPLTFQFGAPGNDRAEAVATNSAHSYVFVASIYARADRTSSRAVLRRYKRDGTLVWDRRSPLLNFNYTQIGGLGTDTAGNAYLAYNSRDDGLRNKPLFHALAKYDRNGALRWLVNLRDSEAAPGAISYTQALATTGSGTTYVGINSFNFTDAPEGTFPGSLRQYNSQGALLWSRPLSTEGEEAEAVLDLAVASDGSLYVLTTLDVFEAGRPGLFQNLSKYTSTGQRVWKVGATQGNYAFSHLTVGGGNVYLGGDWTHPAEAQTYPAIAKYDASGSLLLTTAFERTSGTYGYLTDVTADAHANVYVAAALADEGFNFDPLIRKLSPTFRTRWTYRVGRPDDFVISGTTSLVARTSGELYVSGLTSGKVNGKNNGETDAFLFRFDGQGNRVWIR